MRIPSRQQVLAHWLTGWIVLLTAMTVAQADQYEKARQEMLSDIRADLQLSGYELGFGKLDAKVLRALRQVPRHQFVPSSVRAHAYENRPLPIGHGQTISQPFIVAIMTELLEVEPQHQVFELGTGSGYQAAILGELASSVYTMEIIPELGQRAKDTLRQLDYANVHVRVGDGYYGWPEQAPFDRIIVTAAGDHIPPPLIQQLRPGGRLVMPVGSPFLTQQLTIVDKTEDDAIRTREVLPVRFVPITGKH